MGSAKQRRKIQRQMSREQQCSPTNPRDAALTMRSLQRGQPTHNAPGVHHSMHPPARHPVDPNRYADQPPFANRDPSILTNTRQSRDPETINGREWSDYALMSPDARPQDAEDFFVHSGPVNLSGAALGVEQTVVSYTADKNREARLQLIVGQSVTAADLAARNLGYDLIWELKLNGSNLPRVKKFTGGFSSFGAPLPFIVHVPCGQTLSLVVIAPVVGGTRDIQGYLKGLTYPILRGMGRVSSGWQKP